MTVSLSGESVCEGWTPYLAVVVVLLLGVVLTSSCSSSSSGVV